MLDLTIDNQFRHPFRWGKCPLGIRIYWIFGLKFYKQNEVGRIKKRWVLVLYFGRRFRMWSNYPLN